mgnify:CR=1 FL=1
MKLLIIFSLLLSFGATAAPLSEPELKQRTEQLGISENIGSLSGTICGLYRLAGDKVALNVKVAIEKHMLDYEKIANPTPEQIIQFLNRNKNFMACGKNNKHYMMVSFEHGAYDQLFNVLFYDWLLVDDDSLYIDVNAYSFTGPPDGTSPESLLDYMYRATQNLSYAKLTVIEIKELIEVFEFNLGAKRYRDFTPEQKQLN